MILEKINRENEIKYLNKEELPLLAEEIREFLIHKISSPGDTWRPIWEWWS